MMLQNNVRNEFLGCMGAITVHNTYEFEEVKQFMGIEGLFTKEGNIAQQMSCSKFPATIYRDTEGMYVDHADESYLRNMHYAIYDYEKVCSPSNEQLNFFGDETAPGMKQPDESLLADDPMADEPIEAEANVVENELSLDVILDYATVGTITPAECDGLIVENKNKIIEFIKKYDNIVVTKENYLELKENVVNKFKGKIDDLKKENTRFNKEVNRNVKPFSEANLEVRKAIESVLKPLIENIKSFEEEEKEKKIEEFTKEFILPRLFELLQNKLISEEQVNEFKFNDKWLKKTSTGNLTKATKEGIETELNRLSEMYAQKQKDIETIRSTVSNLASAHGVDSETLKANTYIDLYNRGVDMPGVQQRINADLENIKRAVEREKEKARIEAERKQREALQTQNVQQVQNTMTEEKTEDNGSQHDEITTLADEKTGEVIAIGNSQQIKVKIGGNKAVTNTYEYVYCFNGNLQSMITFNRVIKLLAKMFGFKAERILQVKSDEHRKLVNEFKEKAGI